MIKTPSFRLDDKRALVVGGSSGIGQACALALGEYGAQVTIAARRLDALTKTLDMIQALGGDGQATQLDISDIAATETWLNQQAPFDVLVNSAGLARHAPALDTSEADFDAVANVNIKAAYFLTRGVAKGLINAGKSGSLINISSQMAKIGGIDRTVYAASKHALEGMSKSMAIEWGHYGIRVNTICPTFIRTALTAETLENPDRVKWIKEKIKLNRIGEVQDIMGAVVFLASDASAMITGTALMVDGGWTAG